MESKFFVCTYSEVFCERISVIVDKLFLLIIEFYEKLHLSQVKNSSERAVYNNISAAVIDNVHTHSLVCKSCYKNVVTIKVHLVFAFYVNNGHIIKRYIVFEHIEHLCRFFAVSECFKLVFVQNITVVNITENLSGRCKKFFQLLLVHITLVPVVHIAEKSCGNGKHQIKLYELRYKTALILCVLHKRLQKAVHRFLIPVLVI